jgi:hypothetical protein
MRDDIIKYLCEEVERRCQLPSNHFGIGCFYHIQAVVNHAEVLAERCVADADAISHFDNVPSLLYLPYANKKLGIDEGREFVRNKLKWSYEKLSGKSKTLYKAKYDQEFFRAGSCISKQ